LRNVQSVRFADQTITIPAPTVNAATLSPGLGDLTTGRVVLVTLDMSAPAPPTSCSAIRPAAGSTTFS
jgi:hypothetical protein